MKTFLLMPEFQLLAWALTLFVAAALRPNIGPRRLACAAAIGATLVLAATFIEPLTLGVGRYFHGLYSVDGLAIFFKQFFLVTLIVVVWMAAEFAGTLTVARHEFLLLPLLVTVGLLLLASAVDFTLMFVALELVTISFYVLVACQRDKASSLEAGVKYLVIGALSTGFLVYGIAFLYGNVGGTSFRAIGETLTVTPPSLSLLFALALILAGLGFKIAAVPFHVWAPDVYQGAPTPVTAFLAVGSKAAGFVLLLRLVVFGGFNHPALTPHTGSLLAILAGATVVLGTFAALPQRNLKRLLAYSGIGHAGFMLIALSCLGERGVNAVLIYLVSYLFAALLAFFLITVVAKQVGGEELTDFSGLSKRSPLAAFALTVAFVSMAGIPPLLGFAGKFGVLAAAWEGGHYVLVAVGVIAASVGLYYYLGIVRYMYWNEPAAGAVKLRFSAKLLVWLLVGALTVFGIYQMPIATVVDQVLLSRNW
ncbi:MAG: NADH-quinone oxidoreductase subunit N [Verrucomicrobiales bacterium]|jgi:NADH-quinone oxidoreductase subunit N|nr:NADH-quinone oxidoreductase subunit N [Verrucomicrobiales bacterium]